MFSSPPEDHPQRCPWDYLSQWIPVQVDHHGRCYYERESSKRNIQEPVKGSSELWICLLDLGRLPELCRGHRSQPELSPYSNSHRTSPNFCSQICLVHLGRPASYRSELPTPTQEPRNSILPRSARSTKVHVRRQGLEDVDLVYDAAFFRKRLSKDGTPGARREELLRGPVVESPFCTGISLPKKHPYGSE